MKRKRSTISSITTRKGAASILLGSIITLLLIASVVTPTFARSTKPTRAHVTSTKTVKVFARYNYDDCGSYTGSAVDYWYCWVDPPDDNTAYQYDAWEKHHDIACWTHSTGFAQAGTGPYYWDLEDEDGSPTPECP